MRSSKYPKTYHLEWSNYKKGDKFVANTNDFMNKRVIVTEKMEGINVTLNAQGIMYKSLFTVNHPSKDWIVNYWSILQPNIPHNINICGENCFAKTIIHYTSLPSYFMAFGVWSDSICMSWDESVQLLKQLRVSHVKVLYDGIYDEDVLFKLCNKVKSGYVVRVADQFNGSEYSRNVAKFMHPQEKLTISEWTKIPVTPNILGSINYG